MCFQNRSKDDIAKWIENYNRQYSSEMQKKRLEIKMLIEKAYTSIQIKVFESPVGEFICFLIAVLPPKSEARII